MKHSPEIWRLPEEQLGGVPQQEKIEAGQSSDAERRERKEGESLSAALAPEEEAEKQEILAEVKRGLGEFYEVLPHDKAIGVKEVESFLELAELTQNLPPLYKNDLVLVIIGEGLNQLPKEEFITTGVEVLGLWIHTQALVRSAKKKLEGSRVSPESTSPTKELPPQSEEEHSPDNDNDN